MAAKSPILLSLFPALSQVPKYSETVSTSFIPRELWLCLYFPKLALESVYSDTASRLCAVVEERAGRAFVHTASLDTEALGVRSGMPMAACLALCADLEIRAYNPVAQQTYLERLAKWSMQFSSFVSLQPPHALLLEIGGSLRLFGGVNNLLARISVELSKTRPLHITKAVTPIPSASFLLAKAGCEQIVVDKQALRSVLGHLCTDYLSCDVKLKQKLKRAGLNHLRDLWRLPLSSLTRRFGRVLTDELNRSLGETLESRTAFQTLPPYHMEYPFNYPVYDRAMLQAAIDVLNDAFEKFLQLHDLATNRCDYRLYGQRLLQKTIIVGVRSADRDARRFSKLFSEQLHDLQLTEPVANIHLFANHFVPFTSHSADLPLLFDGPTQPSIITVNTPSPQSIDRLLEQLQARLGHDKINGIGFAGDHRPEMAHVHSELESNNTKHHPLFRRPLWLLSEPKRINTQQGVPCYHGPVCIEQGPERIESGWWSGHDISRDYYVARDHHGRRLWIYRELQAKHHWYLHGLFA